MNHLSVESILPIVLYALWSPSNHIVQLAFAYNAITIISIRITGYVPVFWVLMIRCACYELLDLFL